MSAVDFVIILIAGVGAGTINAVVGSGSLITFPTLISLGYDPLIANVSNNIGLVPGSLSSTLGYRRELQGQGSRIRRLAPASIVGAATGSTLLLVLPSSVFDRVVIVLIALALVLVVVQPTLSKRLAARRAGRAAGTHDAAFGTQVLVALTGVYGGYFGAGQGIILIAILGIMIDDNLQRLNGCKNLLSLAVNAVAAAVFIATTDVDWKVVAAIAIGATVGGQIGARYGRKLNPKALRALIVVVGTIALIRLV